MCQAWNHLAEAALLNSFCLLPLAALLPVESLWLLYSSICMLPWWKKPSWNRFRVEGSCTLQVQLYYILSVVPQRKDCDNRDILLGSTCHDLMNSFSPAKIHLTKICQLDQPVKNSSTTVVFWQYSRMKFLWPFTESFSILLQVLLLAWKTI